MFYTLDKIPKREVKMAKKDFKSFFYLNEVNK